MLTTPVAGFSVAGDHLHLILSAVHSGSPGSVSVQGRCVLEIGQNSRYLPYFLVSTT